MIAGESNSFQVMCFNVVLYGIGFTFLPANFTFISFLAAICKEVLTLFHHRFYRCFNLFKYTCEIGGEGNSTVFFCLNYEVSLLHTFWGCCNMFSEWFCYFGLYLCISCISLFTSLPHQSLKLKFLCNGKKGDEIFLKYLRFTTL